MDWPDGWQVWYENGSTFSSAQGDNWRQLSATGVVLVHLQWSDGRFTQLLGSPFVLPSDPTRPLTGPGMDGSSRSYKQLLASIDF